MLSNGYLNLTEFFLYVVELYNEKSTNKGVKFVGQNTLATTFMLQEYVPEIPAL